MKKILLLGLIVILSVSMIMSGCAKPEEKPEEPEVITWRLHHDFPNEPQFFATQGAIKFADLCDEYTDGRLQVKLYGDGEIYKSFKDAAAAVFAGDFEVAYDDCVNYPVLGIPESDIAVGVPMFGADMDTIWEDIEEFMARPDGGKKIQEIFIAKGARVYYVFPFVFTVFGLSKKVTTLDDFKGMKVRAPGGMWLKEVEATGATGVVIAWGEVPMSLKTGVVDGLITDRMGYTEYKMWELGVPYVPINLHANYSIRSFLIGNKAWDMLPAELQAIVDDKVIPEVREWGIEVVAIERVKYLNAIKANAIMYELSDDVIAEMQPRLEAIYDDLEAINPELWAVRKQVSGL